MAGKQFLALVLALSGFAVQALMPGVASADGGSSLLGGLGSTVSNTTSGLTDSLDQTVETVTGQGEADETDEEQSPAELTNTVEKSSEPLTKTVSETVTPLTNSATELTAPLVQEVAKTAEPLIETANKTLAPVTQMASETVQPLTDTTAETLAPLTETIAETTAPVLEQTVPVVEATAPLAEPLIESLGPVVESLAPVVQPLTEAAGETLAPVTQALEPALEPIAEAVEPVFSGLEPVVEPVLDAVEPVIAPIAEVVQPATEPVIDVLAPVTNPIEDVLPPAADPIADPVSPDPLTETELPINTSAPAVPVAPSTLSEAPLIQTAGELGGISTEAGTTQDAAPGVRAAAFEPFSAFGSGDESSLPHPTAVTQLERGRFAGTAPVAATGQDGFASTSITSLGSPAGGEQEFAAANAPRSPVQTSPASSATQVTTVAGGSSTSGPRFDWPSASLPAGLLGLFAIGALLVLAVTEASPRTWQFRPYTPPA